MTFLLCTDIKKCEMPGSRSPSANWLLGLLVLAWVMFAILVWQPLLWPAYSPTIMNDGDTPLYTSYALNLARCPLAVSQGLMVNALGLDCQSTLAGQPFNYYLDHPSGMAWLLMPFVLIGDQPMLAARWLSCIVSIAMVLLCAAIAARSRNAWCAIGVLLASLLVRVFWWHAVSINLNQAALMFSVAAVGAFIEQQRSGSRIWLAVSLLAFTLGCFVDWPVFFIAGPIGLRLLIQKQWRVFTAYLITGVTALVVIFAMLVNSKSVTHQAFDVHTFFVGSFTGQFQKAPHILPIGQALHMSFHYLLKNFSLGVVLLFIALASMFKQSLRSRFCALYFFVVCFFVQGLMNQLLFLQWSATHNYWSYYYLPAVLVSGGILFETLALRYGKLKWLITPVLTLLLLGLFQRQTAGWRFDYAQPPESTHEYLQAYGLENMLSSHATLFSNNQDIFSGQGFKTRLDFTRSAQPLSQASNAGCKNVYLVFRNSALDASMKAQYPGGITLDRFDWYVVPRNLLRADCASDRTPPQSSGTQ